ncbi:MAG: hydrogenase maturation nickel metallochaperone HypA [bacterium]|nr:hydrogenase maturation nickel metallochaperone HypA [bacterium]
MHEFAIAMDIIETVTKKVTPHLETVQCINLEVGQFSGIVAESLDFGLKTLLADKDNPHVAVNIKEVPTIARCQCGNRYQLKEIFEGCEQCRSFERKLESGMDITIKSVDISEV